MVATGITECLPDACMFGTGDDPCVLGSHTEGRHEALAFTTSTFTATQETSSGVCTPTGMVQVTEWSRVP